MNSDYQPESPGIDLIDMVPMLTIWVVSSVVLAAVYVHDVVHYETVLALTVIVAVGSIAVNEYVRS